MKQIKRIPVTREGYEKLQQELRQLHEDRPQAVKNLADARSMGDLSENGLYTAAKARLRSIDGQIFRTEIQIKLADIIESKGDAVGIGSVVKVMMGSNEKTFKIVGDYEASPEENKISQNSPIGRALMGKKVGQEAVFNAPKGDITCKVISLS